MPYRGGAIPWLRRGAPSGVAALDLRRAYAPAPRGFARPWRYLGFEGAFAPDPLPALQGGEMYRGERRHSGNPFRGHNPPRPTGIRPDAIWVAYELAHPHLVIFSEVLTLVGIETTPAGPDYKSFSHF